MLKSVTRDNDSSASCSGRDLWRKLIISEITLTGFCYFCTNFDKTNIFISILLEYGFVKRIDHLRDIYVIVKLWGSSSENLLHDITIQLDLAWVGICEENRSSYKYFNLDLNNLVYNLTKTDRFLWIVHVGICEENQSSQS